VPKTGLFHQELLRTLVCAVDASLYVGAVWLHIPRTALIVELDLQDRTQFFLQFRGFDWRQNLYPAFEIASHEIGRADEIFFLAAILEVIDPAVLEEPPDHADPVTFSLRP